MTQVVLFTRDLRVRDQPALTAAAATGEDILCLFVRDEVASRRAGPHRAAAMEAALASLRGALRARGADLVIRSGAHDEVVAELGRAFKVRDVHVSGDVSSWARRRERHLASACAVIGAQMHIHDGITILPPGAITPAGKDHYRVFTPYWRRWREVLDLGPSLPAPEHATSPDLDPGEPIGSDAMLAVPVTEEQALARLDELAGRRRAPGRDPDRLDRADSTRLSVALHLGTVSAHDVARWALAQGADHVLRQLCWRDLFHQLLAANPSLPTSDLRPRDVEWSQDAEATERWRTGQTGVPIVDAAMRELAETGWMHNRVRMVVGSFLTKTLGVHWTVGARWFERWLIDADVANNSANWQWIAGTGTDTRPNRVLNPIRQARRLDPEGDWVRRWVPELRAIEGRAVHEPWKRTPAERAGYPDPIIAV